MRFIRKEVRISALLLALGAASAGSAWSVDAPRGYTPSAVTSQKYPVGENSKSIAEAFAAPNQWEGRAASVEGKIRSVVVGLDGHRNIELLVDGPGEITIWATWPLVNVNSSFFLIGEKLRILGWLGETARWSKELALVLPRQNPLTLLSICLVKIGSMDAVFDKKYLEYCEAWGNGLMPPNLAE